MLKGHIFLYQVFGNEICAKIFDTYELSKNGIFKDYGDEMEVTYSGSDITISSGVAMIGGRAVQETSSTTLDAGTNTLFCKLVLTINLDAENTSADFNQGFYEILTNASDYPAVTQDDIVNNQTGKYQFELAKFTTGISGIDNFVDLRSYLELPKVINDINTLEDKTINAPSIQVVESISFLPKNAGVHNSIYRGKDITTLFYNGTLSTQIANGTFDDIFIGDYIIGQNSNRKYIVADINYRLHKGNTECTTNHILMIPEKSMGNAKMNSTGTTTGAYIGSAMYTTNLTAFKTVITNDFGSGHILIHDNYFKNAVSNGYESAGSWYSSTVDLMNEQMVMGCNVFHNIRNGTNVPQSHEMDNTQIAIFRYRPDLIICRDDSNIRTSWWLRDVASANNFSAIVGGGLINNASAASDNVGVRPAFLVY